MCDYKILHNNESGYVVKCKKCDCIKVAFGTTVITLTRAQFDDFTEVIREYREVDSFGLYPNHKSITIPTACKSIQLLYSREDLDKLSALLEESFLSLAIEQFL